MADEIKEKKTRLRTFTTAENEFLLNNERIVDYYKARKKDRTQIAQDIEDDMKKEFFTTRDFIEIMCRLNNLRNQYQNCCKLSEFGIKWKYFRRMSEIMQQVQDELSISGAVDLLPLSPNKTIQIMLN
ncbi:hypothetical protein PVAND_013824 [Polypedilum vanderplanki]|uniref:Uncharacterized protein n=1 Tax=Polypedilum vanderplanki TaxID=319348 RepID=A0A9J6CRW6_POLVA|nr:hypothetical protein PVAND_013824 [Polypedilum vanderplanki]